MANATLHCQTYSTATPFLAKMRPLLEVNEAANGLLLGLALRVEGDPHAFGDADPYFATVEDDTDVIVAALMTPPHGVILYGARPAADVSIPRRYRRLRKICEAMAGLCPRSMAPVRSRHALRKLGRR
ncbi:MAG: hypothetical protein R2932_34435 [Caldilineaceae bacterium]